MGKTYGKFKFSIGDIITTYGRNIKIIDRTYKQKSKTKNGSPFIANEKFYKYKCLKCGNEDWVIEYSIDEKQHCGCNACCTPPKKIAEGINDISTTAGWIVPLLKNADDAKKYHKYSKEQIKFICPHCGREYIKPIHNVVANKGLSCVCGDGMSYPNKYMYSLLEQLGINFEIEKKFDWSENRVYDFYINNLKCIIEMHGRQHYDKPFIKSERYRTLENEKINDMKKETIAKENGIDYYFQIDCSESNSDFIKGSIIQSGLLNVLSNYSKEIDWSLCDKFALSNLVKTICIFKNDNPHLTLHDIADVYKLSYKTVLQYIKNGNKLGWCNYDLNSDRIITEQTKKVNRNQKPIYCETNGIYYRDSGIAADHLSNDTESFGSRQIRKSITRNGTYKGLRFLYITKEEFNTIKLNSPDKVVGDSF